MEGVTPGDVPLRAGQPGGGLLRAATERLRRQDGSESKN